MVVFVPVPVVDTNRTGSGMKTLGSGRARDLYIGLGLFLSLGAYLLKSGSGSVFY
jgi:hypothetical protein